ncbi:hypothetical protein CAPTEDRAFT_222222 [Capitella teleta]|uniref:C2H2-type domain-containing protein n=1 Tax=Capitella teleta TaxID=283909 RepID=R7UC70_CAPTE|nr:hypothetical protein CAPTEDRAFT_222222 [Capitella teleta]|eukprot:ELU03716.1 hypothetical protein CAPTEDRAFT_222222 [Capitella teleta]
MSTVEKPSLLELHVPQDIIKDLADPEKIFKSCAIDCVLPSESDNTHALTARVHFERVEGGRLRLGIEVVDKTPPKPVVECASVLSQTDIMESLSALVQTEPPSVAEAPVQASVEVCVGEQQTDVRPVATSLSQTDSSMALQEHRDSQTFIAVQDFDSQTEVIAQSTCSQTVVDESHALIQTDSPDLSYTLSQTDFSLANLVEQDVQATADMANKISQIEAESQHQLIQTTSSMSLLAEADTQVEAVILGETQSQTDATDVTHGGFQTEPVETGEQDCQTEEVVAEPDHDPDTNGIDLPAPVEGLQDANFNYEQPSFEVETQTDPVTIIIGDASFLVKKLKGNSASPAKVTSAGNEIEIEVNADKPPPDRKPRYVHQYSSQRRGGARVRMPVSRAPVSRGSLGRGAPPSIAAAPPPKPQEETKFNCPFCSLMFTESPALYEHIQEGHSDQRNLIKKPKGREGRTIVMQPDEQPPVLVPVVGMAEVEGVIEGEITPGQEIFTEAVLDPVAAADAIGKRKEGGGGGGGPQNAEEKSKTLSFH